jgi:hypothetical protein
MRFRFQLLHAVCLSVLVAGLAWIGWLHVAAAQRVERISSVAAGAIETDRASPTGYVAGVRRLILPEPSADSYQWLLQVEQMGSTGNWRLRHVEYDNAPHGREVRTPSPYRWWLAVVAWGNRLISDCPWPLAVERAALWADPILHALLLIIGVALVAWGWGCFPATLTAAAGAVLFPFASTFRAGQPGEGGWSSVLVFGSVLAVLSAWGPRSTAAETSPRARRCFVLAGVIGALGLWVDATAQAPVVLGLAMGALICGWWVRSERTGAGWRWWGVSGAVTTLAAWLVEFSPDHLSGGALRVIHPWYALAWWGLGESVARTTEMASRSPGSNRRWRERIALAGAVIAVGVAGWMLVRAGSMGVLAETAASTRLSRLPGSPVAKTTWDAWLEGGAHLMWLATLLPLVIVVPAVVVLGRRDGDTRGHGPIAVALGPIAVMLAVAFFRLGAWSALDAAVLALLVPLVTRTCARAGWSRRHLAWSGAAALVLLPALIVQAPQAADELELTEGDVEALVQRDLAHWLANRVRPESGIVLAPPRLSAALIFHGGARGLVTPYWENRDGFNAAVRIAATTSPDEAQGLAERRQLTHLVLPSWDGAVKELARVGSLEPERTLMALIDQWLPPRWLRPVAYQLPGISGFEGRSVLVLEVSPVLEQAEALGRLAEFFIEMEQYQPATAVAATLRQQFPAVLDSLLAQAQVAAATGDAAAFGHALRALMGPLSRGAAQELAWDRRLALAAVLAQGRQMEVARGELDACLAELDEPRLRSLTLAGLLRFQRLLRGFEREIEDSRLRELAARLVPPELREK